MFLYELALETGERSPDLVARAHRLGLTGVGPGTLLDPAQVSLLRGNGAAVPPPPPPSRHQAGPWAAPPGVPVPALVGGAAAPVAEAGSPAESEDDSSRRSQWIAVGIMAPFLVVLFAFMFANSEPDRPEQRASTEAATSSVPTWDQPPIAGGLSGTNEGSGRSPKDPSPKPTSPAPAPPTTNCGRGPDQAQGVAGRGATVGCDEAAETVPAAPAPAGSGGAVPGLPPSRTVDRYDFCRSVVAVNNFEAEVSDAVAGARPGEAATLVLDGRGQWRADLDAMIASGPEDLQVTITYYRDTLGRAFDSITAASSNQYVAATVAAEVSDGFRDAATAIGQRVARDCA